jgi:CRP-like cAMP-binding protein
MSKTEHPDCGNCSTGLQSIFCELATDEVQQLTASKSCVLFKKGQAVFLEGTYPRGLYCVHKGKIKVTQIGIDGREQIVHLAKDTDVMGYRAILSSDKYSCSAIAMEDSSLCFIPKEIFLSLVEKNSKFALQVIQLFSKELKDAEKKITSIAQRPVKERIAQSLLLLKEHYGFEKDGCTIDIVVTREEIANISGTTRETVIRALFELQKDNIIELSGKKIRILNNNALRKTANAFD